MELIWNEGVMSCCNQSRAECTCHEHEDEPPATNRVPFADGILIEDPPEEFPVNNRKELSMKDVFFRGTTEQAAARQRADVLNRLALNVEHQETPYLAPIINYAQDVAERDAAQRGTPRTTERTDNAADVYLPPVPDYVQWSRDRSQYGGQ